jgi:hypothetical protein
MYNGFLLAEHGRLIAGDLISEIPEKRDSWVAAWNVEAAQGFQTNSTVSMP